MKFRNPNTDPRSLLAQQLLASGSGSVNNVGEGINKAVSSLTGAFTAKKAENEEQKLQGEYSQELKNIFKSNPQGGDAMVEAMLNSPNRYVRDMGSQAYGEMIGNILTPKDPIKLGSGDVLLDPKTNKPLYEAPRDPNKGYKVVGNTLFDINTMKPVYEAPAGQNEPLVIVMGQDGKPVYMPRSQASGMQAPDRSKNPKDLTPNNIDKLTAKAGQYQTMQRLADNYQENYGGNVMTGGLENLAGRYGGEKLGVSDPGQTQWWQDYQAYANQIRNDLFGSALTKTEKGEFLKAMITPGMDSKQISKNLQRQLSISNAAKKREVGALRAGNYNQAQLDEIFGQDINNPEAVIPEGIDPMDWEYMTPEERALFQ